MKKWLPVFVIVALLGVFVSEPVWSQAVRATLITFGGTAQPVSQSGTWTVQPGNTANTTAWKVDGSAVTQPVSGTVTANAGTNLNTSALATEATLDARTGALTETAPASDTASSGLNGRLQRIAQRITSLIALFPTALTGSGNFKVAVVEDTTSNKSVNVAQLAGTTTSVNSGTKDAGTLRVVLATDQPALTNKLLVTPDSVALPANQSVNVSQFGGTNTVTGTGAGGAGIPRVTVSNDSTLTSVGSITNALPSGSNTLGKVDQGVGAAAANRWPVYLTDGTNTMPTGDASSRPVYVKDMALYTASSEALLQKILDTLNQKGTPKDALSLKAGAFNKVVGPGNPLNVILPDAPDPCTKRKGNVAISQTATTKQITGMSAQLIAVCYARLVAGTGGEVVALTEGTGTTCGTGTLAVSGSTTAANGEAYAANGGFSAGTGAAMVATTLKTGDDLCVQQSGSNRVSGQLLYVYYTP